jgi:alpha-beta hydrolase superfamily lysophospholipase
LVRSGVVDPSRGRQGSASFEPTPGSRAAADQCFLMDIEAFSTHSAGYEIKGIVHWPPQSPAPCVICSHGLFSSKDSPKFIAVTEHLAREGFAAIRYDHRGCGESQGRIEDTTVSSRLADLAAVYGFARVHPRITGRVGLMGSSMGGYISLFTAAGHPALKPVVIWATPYQLRRRTNQAADDPYAPLGNSFFEDLTRYRLADVLTRISHCLVVHGQNDELVPVWHAEKIYALLAEPKALQIFAAADHRFSDLHLRDEAIRCSAEYFRRYLH